MNAPEKESEIRRIDFGLKHMRGTNRIESSALLCELPAVRKVSVWRTKPKQWDGPHRIVPTKGETAIVRLRQHRKIFRSHFVRPYTVT